MVIYICDDEPIYVEKVAEVIRNYCDEEKYKFTVKEFVDEDKMLEEIYKYEDADLVFIDIQLKKKNGIDIAASIKKVLRDVSIAYITAYDVFIQASFGTEPIGYLKKPFEDEKIINIVKLKKSKIEGNKKSKLEFVCEHKKVCINVNKILYITSNLRKVEISTTNEKFYSYEKLNDVQDKMNSIGADFVRVHRSILVNFDYVSRYEHDKVILINGEEIPVSRNYRKRVSDDYYKKVVKKYRHLKN